MTGNDLTQTGKPRRRLTLKILIGISGPLLALGTVWSQDVGGAKSSTCESPAFRRTVERITNNPTALRDFGPASCPPETWFATHEDLTDFADLFLATVADVPSRSLRLMTPSMADSLNKNSFESDQLKFTSTQGWGRIIWAERTSDRLRFPGDNQIEFSYKVYDAPSGNELPDHGVIRNRIVALRVQNIGREWKLAEVINNRSAKDDTGITFPRAILLGPTEGLVLPGPDEGIKQPLHDPEGDTVRMICRPPDSTPAPTPWIRTTNGFVQESLFPASAELSSLPTCQPQHWSRVGQHLDR